MILGDHRKRDKPHWADYALAAAFETIDAEKCPKCAVPIWWAYSENTNVEFEHDHVDCQSCMWDEQEKKKIKQDKPGRTLFVKAIPVEGDLPTRADFQNEMIAKAAKEAEKKVKSGNEKVPS